MQSLEKQYRKLSEELNKLRNEKRDLTQKIGAMNSIPHSDGNFSGTRLYNWQQDLDNLLRREDELIRELEAVELERNLEAAPKQDPDRVKVQTAKDARRKELEGELEYTRHVLAERKANLAKAVFDGNDPAVLVGEIAHLQNREAGLLAGLAYK